MSFNETSARDIRHPRRIASPDARIAELDAERRKAWSAYYQARAEAEDARAQWRAWQARAEDLGAHSRQRATFITAIEEAMELAFGVRRELSLNPDIAGDFMSVWDESDPQWVDIVVRLAERFQQESGNA